MIGEKKESIKFVPDYRRKDNLGTRKVNRRLKKRRKKRKDVKLDLRAFNIGLCQIERKK